MRKKEKKRKLRVDKKIQKNNKLLYIVGLIIVCIALFFSVNYYLSRNYVYNIPFTNLDVNGNNPIINSNLNNVGNVYYVNNNKLEKIDDNNKIEALKNSITAMNEKGLITIRTYYNINSVVIKIQNNGPKIEKNIINKIFDVGFTTKNDKNKDHGFGLAIVKELVEKQGGKVTVSSNDSITEFTINIPLKKFLNSLLY